MSLLLLKKRRAMMKQFSWNTLIGTESLTLPNGIKGAFREFSLFGQSEQASTTGTQLLPLLHDITSETGENKLIIEKSNIKIDVKTVNGNDTSNDIYIFGNKNSKEENGYEDVSKYLPAGEYTIFSNFENAFSFVVAWRNGKSITLVDVLSPRPTTFTIKEGDKLRIALRPKKIMIDNGSFIVNKGSTTTDYEPYTGGKPSPSIEYPQEIVNVGRKSSNLFDATKAKSGWITTDGKQSLTTLGNSDNVVSDYIQVYSGMKYTSSINAYKYYYDSEKNFLKQETNTSSSMIIPDNAKYMIVIVPINRSLAIQTADILMINIGSNKLPYEPYTDKKLINAKLTGKNLFDENYEIGSLDASNGNIYPSATQLAATDFIEVIPNENYWYSGGTYKETKICEYDENKKFVSAIFLRTVLTKQNTRYIRCLIGLEKENVMVDNVQVELGTKSTEYEPYQEPQTITIQLDCPLTKWDRIEKRDGVWGVVYCTGVYEDIRESDISANSINDQYGRYYINAIKAYKNAECLCNIAEYSQTQKEDKCGFWWGDTLCLLTSSEYTGNNGTEDYSTAIKNFKENVLSKGITVFYKLNAEEFVPFDEETQTALNSLHTYNGTTNIYVDSGDVEAGIKVTYKSK